MRRKVIAGNWKMNMLPNEAIDYIQAFEPLVKDAKAEVILCVPYTDLFYALLAAQNTNIKIGAQNMHFAGSPYGLSSPTRIKDSPPIMRDLLFDLSKKFLFSHLHNQAANRTN